MKITAIPAQITTVEDKITANLSLTQILLLTAPLFMSTAIFFLLPTFGRIEIYKLVLMTMALFCCTSLSIRINSKLMLDWLILRLAFEMRPRIYVYRKEVIIARPEERIVSNKNEDMNTDNLPRSITLTQQDLELGARLLASSEYRVSFRSGRKGGLNVQVSEN